MKTLYKRLMAKLIVLLALPPMAAAQQARTFSIAGQSDRAAVVQIDGKYYVALDSLAQMMHGTIRFQGTQAILTLPGTVGVAMQPAQTSTPPHLSEDFLRAEIDALTAIREWRAAIVSAVQSNKPVSEDWVAGLHRSADAKLQLAVAAATTVPDHSAVELLRMEFTNMQQMSDQFVALHDKSSNIPTDSFDNNPLDQKIQNCARGLSAMASTKQFQDEPACH